MSDTPNASADSGTATLRAFAEPIRASLNGDAIERIADLGSKATGIELTEVEYASDLLGLPGSFPIAVVHGEHPQLHSLKSFAEEWRTRPAFADGMAKVLTLASFIALTNRHKNKDSAVFADTDWKKPSFTSVIDYHGKCECESVTPENGKHRVFYPFPLSEEWKAWIAGDGKPMSQGDFAAMIEDRMADLAAPDEAVKIWVERDMQTTVANPAQLITLSRGLEINVDAKVKNVQRLQSGAASIQFEEMHKDGNGLPISIPGVFVLNVSPFFMGEPVMIPVRLRYRVKAGDIMWSYHIHRPDTAVTEAVRHAIHDVGRETELPVYEGAPEMFADGRPVRAFTGA